MTRGSPAGSLTKRHFVHNSRSEAALASASNSNNMAAIPGGPGSAQAANGSALGDRKVSRMQMGNPVYYKYF